MPCTKSLPLQAHYQHLTFRECRSPRLAIKSIFSENDMPQERALLEQWLLCAFSVEQLSEQQLIFIPKLHFNLLRLLDVAALLANGRDSDEDNGPRWFDAHDLHWFFKRQDFTQAPCRYFPRYLELEHFINPYRIFASCGERLSLKQWQRLLDNMLAAATTKKTIYDISGHKKLYEHCHALTKLMEAAYLVYVREIQ